MTRTMYDSIKKALEYQRQGDPIKDAFDTGNDERDAVIAAFNFVAKHYKAVHG